MTAKRLAIVLIATGAGALLAWRAAEWAYMGPRRELLGNIARNEERIRTFERALERAPATRGRLEAVAHETLGSRHDEVTHRFRSSLTSIASEVGLSEVKVSSGQAKIATSPAYKQVSDAQVNKSLRNQVDFMVIRGEVSGRGSLEQVLRTMETIRAQPWRPRIEDFVIAPADKERKAFDLRVTVAAMYLPDRSGAPETISIASLPMEAAARWNAIVQKNVFALPAPPPVQARASNPEPSRPKPPPEPPFAQWRVAGIVGGTVREPEVWLVNSASGEHVHLLPGQRLLGMSFVGATLERAVFEFEGATYEVLLNQTLDQRQRIEG